MIGYLKCLLLCLDKLITRRYFAISSFQETFILCNFMVTDSIRSFDKTHEEIRHIQQNIFLPAKDTKTFTLIENIPFGEKECHRSDQKSAKTNLKAACPKIYCDRNSVEFQFLNKSSFENNLLPLIHQAMNADK